MAVERNPVTLLQQRQASFDSKATAWGNIASSVTALRTAAEALTTTNGLKLFSAASSDPSILTASAGATATPGPVMFQAETLAAANQQMSPGFAASPPAAGAGPATLPRSPA